VIREDLVPITFQEEPDMPERREIHEQFSVKGRISRLRVISNLVYAVLYEIFFLGREERERAEKMSSLMKDIV
jgi:hypothetical protein